MELVVDRGLLRLGEDALRYNQLYLSKADILRLLPEWLRRLESGKSAVFLPYSLDDEYVEVLEARALSDGYVALRAARLDELGYVHGDDSVMDYMTAERPLIDHYPEDLLRCPTQVLINAVEAAIASTGLASP